jgi:hypothetical protein
LQKGPPCPDSAIFSLVFTFRWNIGFLLAHLDHFGPATGHPSTFNSPSSHSWRRWDFESRKTTVSISVRGELGSIGVPVVILLVLSRHTRSLCKSLRLLLAQNLVKWLPVWTSLVSLTISCPRETPIVLWTPWKSPSVFFVNSTDNVTMW